MLKLTPIKLDKIWGHELWLASTHKAAIQHDFLTELGDYYPLLIKIIKANDSLSVQVHPDDNTATLLEGSGNVGKTECWYVLDAEQDSKLVYGLKDGYNINELRNAIQENKLEKYLNLVSVKKGDFIFIPSGTVHAIGGGLTLLEIQQSCDITYRLYDWGRPRELHVEKSLKSIKDNELKTIKTFSKEFSCPYFSLEEINVNGGWSTFVSGDKISKNCVIVFVISGEGSIKKSGEQKTLVCTNDTFALFPGEKITFEGHLKLMKIRCC